MSGSSLNIIGVSRKQVCQHLVHFSDGLNCLLENNQVSSKPGNAVYTCVDDTYCTTYIHISVMLCCFRPDTCILGRVPNTDIYKNINFYESVSNRTSTYKGHNSNGISYQALSLLS